MKKKERELHRIEDTKTQKDNICNSKKLQNLSIKFSARDMLSEELAQAKEEFMLARDEVHMKRKEVDATKEEIKKEKDSLDDYRKQLQTLESHSSKFEEPVQVFRQSIVYNGESAATSVASFGQANAIRLSQLSFQERSNDNKSEHVSYINIVA